MDSETIVQTSVFTGSMPPGVADLDLTYLEQKQKLFMDQNIPTAPVAGSDWLDWLGIN